MKMMISKQPILSFTKILKKHEKLYRLAMKKLSEVELEREEFSTKVDEVNQIIGALRFENKIKYFFFF